MKDYGYGTEGRLDFPKFKANRDAYVKRLNSIYQENCKDLDYVEGMASFKDSKTVVVGGKEITAHKILIASGSYPGHGEFEGHEHCMDSNDFFAMESLPESVVVLGGGYIAVELGQMLKGLGVKDVTIVARSSILKFVDAEITA